MESRSKYIELAEESASEGNADKRDEEEGQRSAEQGRAISKPAIVLNQRKPVREAACVADDGKDAHVHSCVAHGVEAGSGNAVRRKRGEGHQQVSGMRDRGICQHALDILLPQSA